MNKKILSLLFLFLFMPVLVFSAFPAEPTMGGITGGADAIRDFVTKILGVTWIVFVGVAIVMFIVAGIQFLTAQGDPGKISTARQSVIWGSVGIVVALVAYSIITILKTGFGIA